MNSQPFQLLHGDCLELMRYRCKNDIPQKEWEEIKSKIHLYLS